MKPVRPDDSECCGSGCKPCIFDVYEDRLRKWESKEMNQSSVLDQIKHTPFFITDVLNLNDFLKIFHFQAVRLLKESSVHIKKAQIGIDCEILEEYVNIKPGEFLILKGIVDDDIISRSYTPVLDTNRFQKGAFTVIISLQPNGKMTAFIKKLQTNDIVFFRGPYSEFKHDLHPYKHILLFGGGTGIVPVYNIAKGIVEDELEIWVNVFASFKNTDSYILRKELARLKDFWNFKMSVFISERNESFKLNYNESVVFNRLDESIIESEIKKCGKEFFVIICGPEGFNHFVKSAFNKFGVKEDNIFVFW